MSDVLMSIKEVLNRIQEIKQRFHVKPKRINKVYSSTPAIDRESSKLSSNSGAGHKDFKQELDAVIQKAAKKYNLTPELISSIIKVESGFNPEAKSPKGAMGLMQLMPKTAAELGIKNILDPEENVLGGTKYFRNLLDKYNGDIKLALSAYNAGPGRVDRNKDVPNIKETKEYIKKVLKEYYG